MKFFKLSSTILLPATLCSFCGVGNTFANDFNSASSGLVNIKSHSSLKDLLSRHKTLVLVTFVIILTLCYKFFSIKKILKFFSSIKEKFVNSDKEKKKNTETCDTNTLLTKASNKNNNKKKTASDTIKEVSLEELDIVDLAKTEKYKEGVLKAIYSYFFLSDCDINFFFVNSKKDLLKRFVTHFEKLRKNDNVRFGGYNVDNSTEVLICRLRDLVKNIKEYQPELKKPIAEFLLKNIDGLSNFSKNQIKRMYFGKLKHECDNFIKKDEKFSPQSLSFRGLDVEKTGQISNVLMRNDLESGFLKGVLKKLLFENKAPDIYSVFFGCDMQLIIDTTKFIEKLSSENKVSFNKHININITNKLIKLVSMFRAIQCSSDEVKETIVEFLFKKMNLLGEKGANFVYKKYKFIESEEEKIKKDILINLKIN